jgi:signal transduction histidine kinase
VSPNSFSMAWLKPRTIRGQLTSGLILFEILALVVFSIALVREQHRELQTRTDRRLEYQASQLAIQSSSAMADHQYGTLDRVVAALHGAPGIHAVLITDLQGRTLFSSDPGMKGKLTLSPHERLYLRELNKPIIFSFDERTREAVAPVRVNGAMQALVWIYPDDTADRIQLRQLLAVTLFFALVGVIGCTIFASLMAKSIARPIRVLMHATRRLIRDPEDTAAFPLPVVGSNEAADLAVAFNRMVAAIQEQRAERRRTEDALRRTEKLAAAGRLAASIAHEVNNPLEAVTNLLFLLRQAPLDSESARYAELAAEQTARVSEITQQALRFYRQSTLPAVTNIPDLIESVVKLHRGRINAFGIKVCRCYAQDVQLFCFAGELRQLFANLIGNAIDSMAVGGGRLLLRVRYAHSVACPDQRGVRITIADTGIGMSREVQRHIFEPFFTTKEPTGAGLGLWVSAEIIGNHDGSIRVRSRARAEHNSASGTVFAVFFPLRSEPAAG